jgi:hypothetical protein
VLLRLGDAAPRVGLKLLLLIHAVSALALVGASTHSGLLGIAHLRGRAAKVQLDRLYSAVVFWLYLVTFMLGAFIYPSFRVDVRAAYLDEALPLGTRLFELKEHLIALGAVGAIIQGSLGRRADRSPAEAMLFDVARICVMGAVIYAALVGLFLVSVKSI